MTEAQRLIDNTRKNAMSALDSLFVCGVGLHEMQQYMRGLYVALALDRSKGSASEASKRLKCDQSWVYEIIRKSQSKARRRNRVHERSIP